MSNPVESWLRSPNPEKWVEAMVDCIYIVEVDGTCIAIDHAAHHASRFREWEAADNIAAKASPEKEDAEIPPEPVPVEVPKDDLPAETERKRFCLAFYPSGEPP